MEKLQAILEGQIGKGNIHNIVAAVQSEDQHIDFVGAAGIANPKDRTAMKPSTPYFIASVTKMYTAAIVLHLYEEKRIDLDAPITTYLPVSLTRKIHIYIGVDYSDRIKVSHLIDQSSGLADYETDKLPHGKTLMEELQSGQDREITTEEALEITRRMSPRFAPDTPGKAHYSNANYRLLGAIIEAITDQSMAENFQKLIFEPLVLQSTYLFDWTKPSPSDPPATIYMKDNPIKAPKYISSNTSDGGLVSTASETIKFLRAFFSGQLFDKKLFERMLNWKSIFFPLRYGYGLMNFKMPLQPELIGHSGSTGSFAFICPSKSLYLAGTINQMASPAKPFFLMSNLVRKAR
jgi:CubicO group peptidase (beta-lactamase class C family)